MKVNNPTVFAPGNLNQQAVARFAAVLVCKEPIEQRRERGQLLGCSRRVAGRPVRLRGDQQVSAARAREPRTRQVIGPEFGRGKCPVRECACGRGLAREQLHACKSDAAIVLRLKGPKGDTIAFLAGGRWSAPVKSTTRGGAFTCHGVEAVSTVVDTGNAAQPALPDPADPIWRASLPQAAGPAMRRDLDLRLGEKAAQAVDLLLPLAYARGGGLPWEDVWPLLANALASGYGYTNEDLLWLVGHAGSFIVEGGTIADRSIYRLYHRSLTEDLLTGRDQVADQRTIATALASLVNLIDTKQSCSGLGQYGA